MLGAWTCNADSAGFTWKSDGGYTASHVHVWLCACVCQATAASHTTMSGRPVAEVCNVSVRYALPVLIQHVNQCHKSVGC